METRLTMRTLPSGFAALLLLAATSAAAQVPDTQPPGATAPLAGWSFTFNYENDLLGGSDRFYTSGLQIAARSPSRDLPGPLRWLDQRLDGLGWPGQVRWGFGLGHQIYTPRDTLTPNPDPRDRPYAAFLYGALVLQRQEANALSTFELQAGVVGPSALGEFIQNNTHDLIRDYSANGWSRQLKDEPAVNLVFERVQRISLGGVAGNGLDILPSFGVSLGNVATHATAGATLRLGQGLDADFGPPRIRPALVGSAFLDPPSDGARLGWYLFASAQGRAVARDIFLDGSTFRDSPSVDRRLLVGDIAAGFVVHWRGLRFSYTQAWRSEEFYGQRGGQAYGSVGVTARF